MIDNASALKYSLEALEGSETTEKVMLILQYSSTNSICLICNNYLLPQKMDIESRGVDQQTSNCNIENNPGNNRFYDDNDSNVDNRNCNNDYIVDVRSAYDSDASITNGEKNLSKNVNPISSSNSLSKKPMKSYSFDAEAHDVSKILN